VLARERAQAVHAALIDHGLDAARVRIGESLERQASEREIHAELALAAPGLK
jgi:hypothetical protein